MQATSLAPSAMALKTSETRSIAVRMINMTWAILVVVVQKTMVRSKSYETKRRQ